jgi:hypothetical protein
MFITASVTALQGRKESALKGALLTRPCNATGATVGVTPLPRPFIRSIALL